MSIMSTNVGRCRRWLFGCKAQPELSRRKLAWLVSCKKTAVVLLPLGWINYSLLGKWVLGLCSPELAAGFADQAHCFILSLCYKLCSILSFSPLLESFACIFRITACCPSSCLCLGRRINKVRFTERCPNCSFNNMSMFLRVCAGAGTHAHTHTNTLRSKKYIYAFGRHRINKCIHIYI